VEKIELSSFISNSHYGVAVDFHLRKISIHIITSFTPVFRTARFDIQINESIGCSDLSCAIDVFSYMMLREYA